MDKTASFSAKVKGELARAYPEKPCCQLAELAAIARLDGTVTIGRDEGLGFYIATEYSAVARKVYRLLKDRFSIEGELTVKRQNRLKRRAVYHIVVNSSTDASASADTPTPTPTPTPMPLATPMSLDALASLGASGSSDAPTSLCVPEPVGVPELLAALGILTSKNQIVDGIKRDLIRTKCCRGSYLRGALLGGGSVSGPDSDYHLEMAVGNEKLGQDLMALTNRFPGLHAKLGRRKQSFLVYLKGSDQIADFLTVTGAHGSLLEFESARVMKGMKNQVNRLVNCETANMDKALDAAFRQVSNIRLIDERIGLDSLDPSLAQIARLRLDNPDANLKELGEIMMPAVGKSGVNHRFRKIEEIAEGLRK